MLDILARWNRWGRGKLESGFSRNVTQKIQPFLSSSEVVVLMGPRRSGKTTVMFQVMDILEKQGVPPEACLHINFEDPTFSPHLKLELFDQLYNTYREEIYPKGKAYLFLDEPQNIPEWEKWVRTCNETENVKIYITGSSAKLLSRELATLLTGRHVAFTVLPLSFDEYLRFKSIDLPQKILPIAATAEVAHALNDFLKWGGFPQIVLTDDLQRKEAILKQYFDDILFKDIVIRHDIRDVMTLRNLAVHLLSQTASLISFKRLAKLFDASTALISSYCQYLQEAFIVDFLSFYSLKVAERNRNPQKVHAIDLGLRQIVNFSGSQDQGRVLETAVYHALLRKAQDNIFYWKNNGEVDFVLREGNAITHTIQVVSDGLEKTEIQQREYAAIAKAEKKFTHAQSTIVTLRPPKTSAEITKNTKVVPAWYFLAAS